MTAAEVTTVTTENDDLVVIGKMSAAQRAAKLAEMGVAPRVADAGAASGAELELAGAELESAAPPAAREIGRSGLESLSPKGWFSSVPEPWEHTSHVFGFLESIDGDDDLVPVLNAAGLAPDTTLKDARIDVTLERLRVAAYPGKGTHRILFDFFGKSQRRGGVDDLHFNLLVRARDGGNAGILGLPIFVGLGVGPSGVAFRCTTVNVKNDEDEALLAALDSDVMKNGLQLLETAQPALGVVSTLAVALTRTLARRHRNVAVQEFSMGLDLGGVGTGARLRVGTYFVVQVPDEVAATGWSEWAYNRQSGLLVQRSSPSKPFPYNHVAFGVRRHGGA